MQQEQRSEAKHVLRIPPEFFSFLISFFRANGIMKNLDHDTSPLDSDARLVGNVVNDPQHAMDTIAARKAVDTSDELGLTLPTSLSEQYSASLTQPALSLELEGSTRDAIAYRGGASYNTAGDDSHASDIGVESFEDFSDSGGSLEGEGELHGIPRAPKPVLSSLRVGEVLNIEEKLVSAEGDSEIGLTDDGSIVLRPSPWSPSLPCGAPVDARDDDDSNIPDAETTLVAPQVRNAIQAFENSAPLGTFGAKEEESSHDKKKMKKAGGFFGRREHRSVDTASGRDSAAQMTISDRGRVVREQSCFVFVDDFLLL